MIEIEKKEKRKKPGMIQTHDILIALALLCNLCLLDIFSLSECWSATAFSEFVKISVDVYDSTS